MDVVHLDSSDRCNCPIRIFNDSGLFLASETLACLRIWKSGSVKERR